MPRLRVEYLLPLVLLPGVLAAWSRGADDSQQDAEKASAKGRVPAALIGAVQENLDYCRQWLDAGDYKSLDETALFIGILNQLLAARGDDADWIAGCQRLEQHTAALRSAADRQEADQAKQQIQALRQVAGKLARTRVGTPRKEEVRPQAGLGPLMKLMDGTYADAKAACTFDEPDKARGNAIVLAELGRLVSNIRSDVRWREHAAAMIAAARKAAEDESADAKTVRSHLRGVYQQCEACHNRDR